jgi:hypothetical protein
MFSSRYRVPQVPTASWSCIFIEILDRHLHPGVAIRTCFWARAFECNAQPFGYQAYSKWIFVARS